MSELYCMLNFNGNHVPLKSLLANITQNMYSDKEALDKMNRLAKNSSTDETDCPGRNSSFCDSMNSIDGKISKEKFNTRLDRNRMIYERNRLDTFKTWPETNPLRPGQLARAGFYYTGLHDVVKCFACNGQVQGWEFGDTAMGEHQRHFPTCEFVKNLDTGNVSLLEVHEKPEFERNLSNRLKQSQRDIERRAKEKEAMLSQEPVSSPAFSSSSSAGASTSSSSTVSEAEEKILDDEESSSLFGDYNKEYVRLESFRTWPRTSPIEPRDLARAGFYYTKSDDTVQCFACFGQIGRWKPSDIPASEHQAHFPNCPFVLGLEVGNDPLPGPPVFPVGIPSPIRSVSAPQPTSRQIQVGQELQRQRSGQLRSHLGPLNKCRHPIYAQEDARLRTFKNWPTSLRISATPRLLARAGFFYTGSTDECKCFYCDGGLKNWEPDDEPWSEHAKWFPRCEWLIQQRGESFIIHVQQVNPPPVTSPQMQFTSPSLGRDETYFDPPHVFQASYQERQAQPEPQVKLPASHVTEGQKNKEMTIDEEKAVAMREYRRNHKEPEAAAEFQSKNMKAFEEKKATPSLKAESRQSPVDDLMLDPTTLMAVEMGYDSRLIRYVIKEQLKKTGSGFSSPDGLLDAIWLAEKMDVDLSSLEDNEGQLEAKKLELGESASSIDIQAKKLASLSINDDPSDDKRRVQRMPSNQQVSAPVSLTSRSSQNLDDKQLCKICLDKELNTVFMPCKHLATCEECASMVNECPMCRRTILTSFQVYMP